MHPPTGTMVATGSGCVLGGVWRSPPLAMMEFMTHPTELLSPHSLDYLRAMLTPGEAAAKALPEAVRAQVLRCVSLELSIRLVNQLMSCGEREGLTLYIH